MLSTFFLAALLLFFTAFPDGRSNELAVKRAEALKMDLRSKTSLLQDASRRGDLGFIKERLKALKDSLTKAITFFEEHKEIDLDKLNQSIVDAEAAKTKGETAKLAAEEKLARQTIQEYKQQKHKKAEECWLSLSEQERVEKEAKLREWEDEMVRTKLLKRVEESGEEED